MALFRRGNKGTLDLETLRKAVLVAKTPGYINEVPELQREAVQKAAKTLTYSTQPASLQAASQGRPISSSDIATRSWSALNPSPNMTPADVEQALNDQGMNYVEPFAPGRPLVPFYGYSKRPRQWDYTTGRNISTEARTGRIPFSTLESIVNGYDVAQICVRHMINDLRSMKLVFGPMPGWEEDVTKEIEIGKAFLRRPDGVRTFRNWLATYAYDIFRYDAGCLYRQRNKAGKLINLKVVDGTMIAPLVDYFGDTPQPPAPAYQQFVQGIPWNDLTTDDLIYEPMWPVSDSPYGVAPIETVLLNANTDVRLQWYFLNFFTAGQVPEAFAMAPQDQSDADSLEEWQETYDAWTQGDQTKRYGLRWLPADTKLEFYKPAKFDPEIAEYVMRRTVAAFGQTPHDLGFTEDVNKSTGDTQMDVQFRISTLPNCGYFEEILDTVLQEELDLPIAVHFDTGREKEDRFIEAQAHQLYVSMGAESPDEVREKVLGYEINPTEIIPRFFDSERLGPLPLSYLLSVSGDIDPATAAPKPGTTVQRVFVPPGEMQPDPTLGQPDNSPVNEYKNPPDESGHDPNDPKNQGSKPGPGIANSEPTKKPMGSTNSIGKDLSRWQSNARSRVSKGQIPRPFMDHSIPEDLYDRIWVDLRNATTAADVDTAFAKAGDAGPKASAPDLGATGNSL